MSKDHYFVHTGKVVETHRAGQFTIELQNGARILAHISGKMRKNDVKVLANDSVDVEISIYDLTKGRIVKRHATGLSKTKKTSQSSKKKKRDDRR